MAYNRSKRSLRFVEGILAGSVALLGFDVDSVIELTTSVTALRRLHADRGADRRARAEERSRRIIGALASSPSPSKSVSRLPVRSSPAARPEENWVGVVLAILSLGVMPYFAKSSGASPISCAAARWRRKPGRP
ncbi:MAG: hypothetical protein AB7I33_09155 [Gemmatimonadales bacterium]